MMALIGAVLIASLLGSTHCAGMCGAFVAFAVADGGHNRVSRTALNAAYNGGRLVTYVLLGSIAGAVGAATDLGGSMVGIQRAAISVVGVMLIVFGVIALLRAAGTRIPRAPIPAALQNTVAAGHRFAFGLPPVARALVVGLLTTLLPCGWLYAFAITAAGTASPLLGAITMAVFWVGTLPVLVGVGVGVQALSGVLRAKLPLMTSMLIVVVGVVTLLGRTSVPAMSLSPESDRQSLEEATARVQSLDAEEMPCCDDR